MAIYHSSNSFDGRMDCGTAIGKMTKKAIDKIPIAGSIYLKRNLEI